MPSVISADGTRIHYDVFGREDGEPLLLLMGLAVDRWGWIRQRADLARRFRCISIDNRGCGLSDKPHGDYDLFSMTGDVLAVLDAEAIESTHVMGYSLGGVLSQVLAVRSRCRWPGSRGGPAWRRRGRCRRSSGRWLRPIRSSRPWCGTGRGRRT